MFITPVDNEQLKDALEGVKEGVQGEREDELFYDYLISVAQNREDKEIIESIRNDERRHNNYFRTIYRYYTGMEIINEDEDEDFERPSSYLDGIKKALFGELRAVEKYREISKNLPNGAFKDVLFEIITDELKHASKYNYLITNNIGMIGGANTGMNGGTDAGFGGTNTGMNGGTNTGFGGANTGMNGGTNTGLGGNMNTGMNGGTNTGLGGTNTGMNGGTNTGFGGTNTGLNGGTNTGFGGANTGMNGGTNTGFGGTNTGMNGGTNTGFGGTNTGLNGRTNTGMRVFPSSGIYREWNRNSMEDTSNFTPDDWVKYITPLVNRALMEAKAGINTEHLYQEFILAGVLVGLGKSPLEAIDQVEEWEKTGESQLLSKSKMMRGYFY